MERLNELNLDATGNVEELRKRFAKFLESEHDTGAVLRLFELQDRYEASTTLSAPGKSAQVTTPIKTEDKSETS